MDDVAIERWQLSTIVLRARNETLVPCARDLAMTGCLAGPDGPGECRALVPASTKISAAHETLVAHEQLVAKAQTSEPPAAAFAELVQL